MEVLLVLAILVILGSMVGIFIVGMQREAFRDSARVQIAPLETALDAYRLHVGSYPNDLTNPAKWRGPYLKKQVPPDPWGNPYQYELLTPDEYRIWSWGPDGADGTEDDVSNMQ